MGDLGPAIVAKITGVSNTAALRPSVLIGLAVFVVLPLGMLRNVDSLSSVSMATIGFYICLVLKVIGESLPHLLAGDWYEHVHFWRPAGIMQCIPIFSMALFCQTQLFEIYESMHNASLDRMNYVIRAACNICTGVYICVGFFGYIAFCTQPFTGNVLMSFTPSVVSEMIKLGFVLSVAVSFPLVIFPCRASLYSLLFRRIGVPHHEGIGSHIPEARFKCLTLFIVSVALVIGLLIPNIELVLGLVGSTIGVLICVMFPAAAFICMSTKNSHDRLLAQVLLFIGALILVLGTYATLYAANNTKLELELLTVKPLTAGDKVIHLHESIKKSLPDVPQKLDEERAKMNGETKTEDLKVKVPPVLPNIKAVPVELPQDMIELSKADKRQEPPIPIEPVGDVIKEVPSASPVIKEVKGVITDKRMKEQPEVPESNIAKEVAIPEASKKEINPIVAEQVDQDAIKKEEEELAEAEKQEKAIVESKNAELLRQLEKHGAQQIKILQEQKQILQALQEHQERELKKDDHEVDLRTFNLKKPESKKLSNIKEYPEGKELKEPENNVFKSDIEKNVVQEKLPKVQEKLPKEEKYDLLKKIANGDIQKSHLKTQSISNQESTVTKLFQKAANDNLKLALTNNSVNTNQKESLPVTNIEEKELVKQVQANHLEHFKSPPIPLIMQNKSENKIVSKEEAQNIDNEVKAIRRDILQEPVANNVGDTKTQTDINNVSPNKESHLNMQSTRGDSIHDREKRDAELIEEGGLPSVLSVKDQLYTNETNDKEVIDILQVDEANCPIGDSTQHSSVKQATSNVGNKSVLQEVLDTKAADISEVPQIENNRNLNITFRNVHNKQPFHLTPELENLGKTAYLNETKNIEKRSSVDFKGAYDTHTVLQVLNTTDNKNTIENNPLIIKTPVHLSNPEISNNADQVTAIKESVIPVVSDTKPMKRDLKSIPIQEEKTENKHSQNVIK